MALGLGALLALTALSQGASAVGGAMERSKDRKSQEALSKEQLALDREQGLMNTALDESLANPFRHQLDQGQTAAQLDMMERASYSPVDIGMPDRYAKYKPTISGGFSWQPSAELRSGAGQLKQSVLAGRTAPSMTSPSNYGKTATLDTFGGADPRTDAAFSTGTPKRTGLGAKSVELAEPRKRSKFAVMVGKARTRPDFAAQLAEFEAAHPGWTVDEAGNVMRRGR